MNRILDRLWIGSTADLSGTVPFRALGFAGVVDLRDSAAPPDLGVALYRVTNRDGDPWNKAQVDGIFEFIHGHIRHGRILVACAAGMSRSASIVIGYLVHCGWDVPAAFAAVKAARPSIAPAVGMLESAITMQGGETATRQAHNLEIAGSIPAPATKSAGTP